MLSAEKRLSQPSSINAPVIEPVKPLNHTSSHHHTTPATWPDMDLVGDIQHIWVITGPAGCGKSTVGRALQEELDVPFLEGDDVSSLSPSHLILQTQEEYNANNAI